MVVGASACGSSSSTSSASNLPTKIGTGEGQLNLVAWEGYAQPEWVKPFEAQTGCEVHAKYAGSSDEMVTLMRQGGGSQYDMVSASGDASLRLIRGGDVHGDERRAGAGMEELHPAAAVAAAQHRRRQALRHLAAVGAEHAALQHASRSRRRRRAGRRSTARSTKAQVTVPDNPIQIADAALYLSKTQPSLGITDPYELTEAQLNAAVKLLKQQRPLIKKYWALASDEIELFKNGDAVIGAAWPLPDEHARWPTRCPSSELIPSEGATGWADTWMLSAHAKHPNCAYKWVQLGVDARRCRPSRRSPSARRRPTRRPARTWKRSRRARARQYHANAPAAYFDSIKFWKTPVADCGNGQNDCTDYTDLAAEVDGNNRIAPGRQPAVQRDRLRREQTRPAPACRRRCSAGRGCGPCCCCPARGRGSC